MLKNSSHILDLLLLIKYKFEIKSRIIIKLKYNYKSLFNIFLKEKRSIYILIIIL